MPYDTILAHRVRAQLNSRLGFTEKEMFGGVGFLLNGNMCVGVWKELLIARLGADSDVALQEPAVRPFDITGRPMSGWLFIEPSGTGREEDLCRWVERAIAHVSTLPAKVATKKATKKKSRK